MSVALHQTDENVLILDGACVVGDVTFGKGCSVWYNAVIRADGVPVTIGAGTNIQDCACIHTDINVPVSIGDNVTIGHTAIVHGCTVGNNTLIGMGAIILTGAKVGSNCIVGAGALVTGKMVIPDGSMVLGSPAKVVRPLREDELASLIPHAEGYTALANSYR